MITLSNLPLASAQEVFDQVARHLLTQMDRSMQGVYSCAYRGDGGLKCAAGCLIGDDEYQPEWETRHWNCLAREGSVPKTHAHLIMDLQFIHDSYPPSKWALVLSRLANNLNLTWGNYV